MTMRSRVVWSLLLVAGCRTTGRTDYTHPQADFGALRRVAVLPFVNQSREPNAGERVTDTFAIELMARAPWEIVDPAQVAMAMRAVEARDATCLSAETIRRLGEQIQADALVFGAVDEFTIQPGAEESYPVVAVSARLVDARTGSVLWAGHGSGNGRSLTPIVTTGTIDTLPEMTGIVCRHVVQSMME